VYSSFSTKQASEHLSELRCRCPKCTTRSAEHECAKRRHRHGHFMISTNRFQKAHASFFDKPKESVGAERCCAQLQYSPSGPTVCLEHLRIFSKITKTGSVLQLRFLGTQGRPAPARWLNGTIERSRCWQQPVKAGEGFHLCFFPGTWIGAKARALVARAALHAESSDKLDS
jgi:hypothetical protein